MTITRTPLEIGYGNGVTGPTAPRCGGVTAGEACRYADWNRLNDDSDPPPLTSEVVSVRDWPDGGSMASTVVAIFPQRGDGPRNVHFFVAAWNCLVTAADTLNVDPLELAEALGEGRLGALLTVRGKPWESDSQFAEALERLVHLPKREAAQ